MDCRVVNLCRGDGKTFIHYAFAGKPFALAKMDAFVPNGVKVASLLFQFEGHSDQFVAIVPQLSVSLDLRFSFFDSDGSLIDEGRGKLDSNAAKWRSRLNYRMHPAECQKIRNYDLFSVQDFNVLEMLSCIPDGEETIVRAKVRSPHRDGNVTKLGFYDDQYRPMNPKVISFGVRKAFSSYAKALAFDEEVVSFRLPSSNPLCVIAMTSESHPELNGFHALDMADRQHREGLWREERLRADQAPGYAKWFDGRRSYQNDIYEQSKASFEKEPTFSIIVPLYKTPPPLFEEMLLSVTRQSYRKWELILVNATPEDAALSAAVSRACADSRVKQVSTKNLGISGNTKLGVDASTGDYICFFDHDDVLEPNILFEYVSAINSSEEPVDALYCDEDKLMPDGSFAMPFFKPDFSIDLLRCFNYICHMLCVRREVLKSIEFPDSTFDGAQDHDIILKVSEASSNIVHVSKVLYHWRLTENSTAQNADSKPYASQAGLRAVESHLERLGISAEVSLFERPFSYKVNYLVGQDHPLVSIVIPSKDAIEVLDKCIVSIEEKTTYDNYEVIIIENNSTDPQTFEYYEKIQSIYPNVRVERWEYEFNFSKLMNFGAQKSRGDYLLLLNNDTEVITPDWIERLVGFCLRPEVGVVGVRLWYADEVTQHAGVFVGGRCAGHCDVGLPRGQRGYFNLDDSTRDLSAVTAACVMTRRDVFEAVDGFTEELAIAFNDIDFCLKVREKGHLVVYTPDVELYHYESFSRGPEDNANKMSRFYREASYINHRWAEYYVKGDPYSNINFDRSEPYCWHYRLSEF